MHSSLLCALLASTGPQSDTASWRAAVAGQLDAAPHGVLEFGVRTGPWSVELLTDTLEGRWSASDPDGRQWIAVRGELFAAGLMNTPWTNGAVDRSRALKAFYAGIDTGWIFHFAHGFYGGFTGWFRQYFFSATEKTTIAVPDPLWVIAPSASGGWWSEDFRIELEAGADLRSEGVSPRARLEAVLHPQWIVAPRLELRAGIAEDQDFVTRTRLGGLSWYSVPLAGASWAEWWVEDYAAVRAGPSLRLSWLDFSIVADAAVFDGKDPYGITGDAGRREAFGLAALAAVKVAPYTFEASFGYAPKIPRGPDVGRVAAWLGIRREWDGL